MRWGVILNLMFVVASGFGDREQLLSVQIQNFSDTFHDER